MIHTQLLCLIIIVDKCAFDEMESRLKHIHLNRAHWLHNASFASRMNYTVIQIANEKQYRCPATLQSIADITKGTAQYAKTKMMRQITAVRIPILSSLRT